jgi:hypothetical protein
MCKIENLERKKEIDYFMDNRLGEFNQYLNKDESTPFEIFFLRIKSNYDDIEKYIFLHLYLQKFALNGDEKCKIAIKDCYKKLLDYVHNELEYDNFKQLLKDRLDEFEIPSFFLT